MAESLGYSPSKVIEGLKTAADARVGLLVILINMCRTRKSFIIFLTFSHLIEFLGGQIAPASVNQIIQLFQFAPQKVVFMPTSPTGKIQINIFIYQKKILN